MFLARQGYEVLGIDLSALAIRQAREKARGRRIDVRFLVWDALELPMLGERWPPFATVVDSAMFHLLGDWERDRFVSGLSAVVASGSLYAVLGDIRRDSRSIYGITPSEIQARFSQAEGWELAFARRSVFERRWSVGDAWFVGVRRR